MEMVYLSCPLFLLCSDGNALGFLAFNLTRDFDWLLLFPDIVLTS